MNRFAWGLGLLGGLVALSTGCDTESGPPVAESRGTLPGGLTPALAAKGLAQVGDKVITLGDYAATLERMDPYERLRYQTPERRQQLLEQIINAELLALEARRTGLAEAPETRERVRIILREQLLADLKKELPAPSELTLGQLREYYDSHSALFSEPERRRLSRIALSQESEAARVLSRALGTTPMQWGRLVREYSATDAQELPATSPVELAGDVGVVVAPGEQDASDIPSSVRTAIFTLDKVGEVYPKLLKVGDEYWIVRLTGRTPPRSRSFDEAKSSIRAGVLQELLAKRKHALEEELKEKFPVTVNEEALAGVKVPAQPQSAEGN